MVKMKMAKVKKSENRFDILRDDDDVIDWHIWCYNITPTLCPLLLTLVPNTDMNIILDLSEHRSLNINEKVIL